MCQNINTHKDFFEFQVKPNLERFRADSKQIFLANNIIFSLFHLYDWWWQNINSDANKKFKNKDEFKKYIYSKCSDFSLIKDIANAVKHCEITRDNPKVSKGSSIERGNTGFGELPWGEIWGGEDHIFVTLDNGEKRDIVTVINNVFEMWKKMIDSSE